MTLVCFLRDICNYCLCERFSLLFQLPQMSFAIFKWQNEFLIIITSQSTSICGTGFMISRSRLWSNFLHWRTNQLLSFHKFPQKIIASCCSNSYPQGWRTVTVLLSVTFDFAPKAATQSAYKPSISAISSWGRTTQTHHQYGGYHLQRYPFRAWYTYRFKSSEPQQLVWLVGTPGDDVSPVASCEDWNVSADDVLYCGI